MTIQLKRNTAAGAAANNEILADGQPGWDKTNGILKIGDGVTHWNDLPVILAGVYAPIGTISLSGVAATVSANGALTVGVHNPVDATSANRAMTLADAAGAGRLVSFEKTDTSTHTVTLTFNLRGAAGSTLSLTGANEVRLLVSKADGSWWPVSDHRTKAFLDASYAGLAAGNTFAGQQQFNGGVMLGNLTGVGANAWLQSQDIAGAWAAGPKWEFGIDTANHGGGLDFYLAKAVWRVLTDGVTTNGSPTVTSVKAQFGAQDVGRAISGTGIPAATFVGVVNSATSIGLSSSASSNVPVNATADGAGLALTVGTAQSVGDLVYLSHNGGGHPTIGLGVTPPNSASRVQVSAGASNQLDMNGLQIRQGLPSTTGKYLLITDQAGTDRLWLDSLSVVEGANSTYGASMVVRGDATNNRPLLMVNQAASSVFGWQFAPTGGNLKLRYITGGVDLLQFDTSQILSIYNDAQMLSAQTVGSAPRDGSHILQAQSKATNQGTLRLLGIASQSANYLTIADSGGTPRLWVDSGGIMEGLNAGQGGSLVVRADASAGRTITMLNQAGNTAYGWIYNGTSMKFRYITGGTDLLQFDTSQTMFVYGAIRHLGSGLGFFNKGSAATKQTITGALSTVTDAAAKAVLTSILAALATQYNLVTDGTT